MIAKKTENMMNITRDSAKFFKDKLIAVIIICNG